MMREILFRGKRIDGYRDNLENGKWVYGSLFIDHNEQPKIKWYNKKFGSAKTSNVDPNTVGQYTDFTDKNGTRFFEGDYWIDTDGDYIVYVVEFRYGQFCFVSYSWCGASTPNGFDEFAGGWGELECEPMTNFNIETIEIGGNIHDNPEILRGETE